MSLPAADPGMTRRTAVFPLDERAPGLLKLQMFLGPVMLIMTLSVIRGASSNVLSPSLNGMSAGASYGLAILLWNLCNSCAAPIAGKVSDIVGRRRWLLIMTPIYVLATIGCGLAPNGASLVFFYALMGVGYGCLNNFQNVVMADVMTGAPRVRYMGLLTSFNNIASMLAPGIAGIIADHGFVQRSFLLLSPLPLVTWLVILWLLPDIRYTRERKAVDYAGFLLLILTVAPFTLALSQGGSMFEWTSPLCITLLVVPVAAGMLFYRNERRAADPVLSFQLFSIQGFGPLVALNLFSATLSLLTLSYMIRYCQDVLHFSATQTGAFATSRIVSVLLAPVVAAWLGRSGRYKMSIILSACIQLLAAVGFYLALGPGSPFMLVLVLQYVYNLGIVFTQTPSVAYMSEILPGPERGMGLATQVLCTGLSATFVSALCSLFMNAHHNQISEAMKPMLVVGIITQLVYLVIATRLHNIRRRAGATAA